MRNFIYTITLLIFCSTIQAQSSKYFETSATALNYGDVLVQTMTNKTVWIKNLDKTASLQLIIRTADTFFLAAKSEIWVGPLDSVAIDVAFKPVQNVVYKSTLLVLTNKSPGQILLELNGNGKLADAYYNSTFNLYDEALKSEFKVLLAKNYVSLGYNTARDNMYGSIDNVGGYVTCVYTGRVAQFNTRTGATSNNFNCEHTWPQSLFSSNEPMKSDIHHLYSTDDAANGKRDNDPFGVVSSPTWSVGGSKWANNVFEPRDEQKGNSARSLFYMALRYQNYSNFLNSQEAILRTWNKQFPPDKKAIDRNNAIYALQKNRNPFVDHPAFADRIISISTTQNRALVYTWGHKTKLVSMESSPIILRTLGDTLFTYLWNSGTGIMKLDSVKSPSGSRCLEVFPITLNPGEFTKISFTEKGAQSMEKPFALYTSSGVILDTLKFELSMPAGLVSESKLNKQLYPNPTHTGIVVAGGFEPNATLTVYDSKGLKLFFTDISSELNEIDLSDLSNGVYFVHIKESTALSTHKICIQK